VPTSHYKFAQRLLASRIAPSFLMSLLGQKLPRLPRNATSALPRSTDINRPARLVRFVPEAGVLTSGRPSQHLDKNSRMAAVNAAGSRQGAS